MRETILGQNCTDTNLRLPHLERQLSTKYEAVTVKGERCSMVKHVQVSKHKMSHKYVNAGHVVVRMGTREQECRQRSTGIDARRG